MVRELADLPEDLGLVPSTHLVAHNHLYWDLISSYGVSEESDSAHRYIK